MVPAKLRCGIR